VIHADGKCGPRDERVYHRWREFETKKMHRGSLYLVGTREVFVGTLGTIYALESLEVVLIGAAFDQDVSLAFMDDGVYQLKKGHQTKGIEVKNFQPTYRALDDYDVNKLYVEREALEARGLSQDDMCVPVEVKRCRYSMVGVRTSP